MNTYKNIINVTRLDMSRKTVTRKGGKKIKGTRRTEKIKNKRNHCKINNHKEKISTRIKTQQIICKQLHRRSNLWQNIYHKNAKPSYYRKIFIMSSGAMSQMVNMTDLHDAEARFTVWDSGTLIETKHVDCHSYHKFDGKFITRNYLIWTRYQVCTKIYLSWCNNLKKFFKWRQKERH